MKQEKVLCEVSNQNREYCLYLLLFVSRSTELEQESLTQVEFFEQTLPITDQKVNVQLQ